MRETVRTAAGSAATVRLVLDDSPDLRRAWERLVLDDAPVPCGDGPQARKAGHAGVRQGLRQRSVVRSR